MWDRVALVFSYWQPLLHGLIVTLELSISAAVIGTFLGFLLSLVRTSKHRAASSIARIYIEFFRGTPVLIQLFWIVFCLPILFHTSISIYFSVMLSMVLYMTAITAETFRSSLRSIPVEQSDACVALSMPRRKKLIYVIAPQVFLTAIPPLLSNVTALFKESALVSTVGVADLMFVSSDIATARGVPIAFLSAAAIIYFIVAFPLTRIVGRAERRLLTMYR